MKAARDIDELIADPVGRFDRGGTHLVWCHSPSLCGTAHWGEPSEADAKGLVRRLEVSIHPALANGYAVFMDARGMESFSWPAFTVVADYVKQRLPAWSRLIQRHAVVVPSGVAGVFVAGLMPLIGANHPLRFFSSVAEAVEWLEHPELPGVLEELAPIVDEARGVPAVVRALRDHLERHLEGATIGAAARAVGQSPRTLQRELKRHGTSFTAEIARTRLRQASALLEHSDEKVEVIARRVGCASSSQLSGLFRQQLGETPAQYRARRRAK